MAIFSADETSRRTLSFQQVIDIVLKWMSQENHHVKVKKLGTLTMESSKRAIQRLQCKPKANTLCAVVGSSSRMISRRGRIFALLKLVCWNIGIKVLSDLRDNGDTRKVHNEWKKRHVSHMYFISKDTYLKPLPQKQLLLGRHVSQCTHK